MVVLPENFGTRDEQLQQSILMSSKELTGNGFLNKFYSFNGFIF